MPTPRTLIRSSGEPQTEPRFPRRRSNSMTTYDGRLELTWTNKALRLLAHEDGSYQWVEPFD